MERSDIGLSVDVSTIVAQTEGPAIVAGLIEVQLTIAAHAKVNSKEAVEAIPVSNFVGQIPAPINDIDCKKRFDPTDSLMVLFHHEITLYHGLIAFMNQSLKTTLTDLKGTIIMNDVLEKIVRHDVVNRVPEARRSLAFPCVLTVRAFIYDLGMRVECMDAWIKQGSLICFIIRPFFHPEQFFTAGLQSYVRKNGTPFDTLRGSQHQNLRLKRMA
jgi:hypothetical protein